MLPITPFVTELPHVALRRLVPDPVQVQVLIGSLLGDARIEGTRGARRMRIAHAISRSAYARWKYERLGSFAAGVPAEAAGALTFWTIAHPLFDDLAGRSRAELLERTAPLGLAVWLADVGRLELRADAFLPAQREALCA